MNLKTMNIVIIMISLRLYNWMTTTQKTKKCGVPKMTTTTTTTTKHLLCKVVLCQQIWWVNFVIWDLEKQ